MKIACVYHNIDLDGWMSAAIVKHWFIKSKEEDTYTIGNLDIKRVEGILNWEKIKDKESDSLLFVGYNHGQPIPDLSEYDEVIMCDISFPIQEMEKINDKLVFIDHHISSIQEFNNSEVMSCDGLRNTEFAACELTWKYFFPNEPMPEIVRLLGRYDCFGHKGTKEEEFVLEFQYGARDFISNYEEAYKELMTGIKEQTQTRRELFGTYRYEDIHVVGIDIYRRLQKDAELTYKNGFDINLYIVGIREPYAEEKKLIDTYKTYKFKCFNKERFNPINFGIDYHKDGYDGAACFHFDGKQFAFSLYNDNGEVDCSMIAKHYNGGGHKGAAGFRLNKLQFNKFMFNNIIE